MSDDNKARNSVLTVNISVKDVEPMKGLVIAAFNLLCLSRSGRETTKALFDLELALGKMGVNEVTYMNPLLFEGDIHDQD